MIWHEVLDFADGYITRQLSARDMPTGTYMIKVKSGSQVRVAKLPIVK
jgi:hypothetical protein